VFGLHLIGHVRVVEADQDRAGPSHLDGDAALAGSIERLRGGPRRLLVVDAHDPIAGLDRVDHLDLQLGHALHDAQQAKIVGAHPPSSLLAVEADQEGEVLEGSVLTNDYTALADRHLPPGVLIERGGQLDVIPGVKRLHTTPERFT
jgi:hypothetical protein